MKLTFLMLLLFMSCTFANSKAQEISFNCQNSSLQKIFVEISKQSGYTFIYDEVDVVNVRNLNLSVNNKRVDECLEQILTPLNLKFYIKGKSIIINKPYTQINDEKTSGFNGFLQKRIISGRVIHNESKEGIEGVTIQIKGTNKKILTNREGYFELQLESPEVFLIFSCIGMKTKELKVKGDDENIVMSLEDLAEEIGDVVITGYGNIKKESFTGSYTHVTKEDILNIAPENLIDILQVFDPSFRVMLNKDIGADPNNLPDFYIRGQSGFPSVNELDVMQSSSVSEFDLKNNPNTPIFIMDGFEVSLEKVFDFDINRIKDITILKDASATAMYGSRASNGVVVIETISPKEGTFQLSFSGNYSITAPDLTSYNLMNAEEKVESERLAGLFLPDVEPDSEDYLENKIFKEWLYVQKRNQVLKGVDTYWLSQPLSTMFNQANSLYLEGGSGAFRIGVDFRYQNQNGVMKESNRDKIGAGFTVGYNFKGLQVRNQISFDRMNSKDSPYGQLGDYSKLQPYLSIYDEYGQLNEILPSMGGKEEKNPLYEANLGSYKINDYEEWTNNLSVNLSLNNYLILRGRFAVNYKNSSSENFNDPLSGLYINQTDPYIRGSLQMTRNKSLNWNSNLFIAYNRTLNQHNVNLSIGLNAKSVDQLNESYAYQGFSSARFSSPAFASEMSRKPIVLDNKTRLLGGFGTLNYSLNDVYLFDASFRLDGSSEFGVDKKWAPFWSLGTGINLHNTEMVKPLFNIISLFRVRGNVGQTGKSNFAPYMARNTYSILLDDWYATGMGANLIYLGNNDLNWEKQLSWNLGFDVSLFRKYNIEVNYYNKKTYDLITDVSLPSSSGFPKYRANIGKVLNKGIEMNFNVRAINTRNFNLVLHGNFAHNTNKIIEIADVLKQYNERVNEHYNRFVSSNDPLRDNETNMRLFSKPIMKYEEGNSLTTIYGMRSLGINPADGQEVYLNRNGDITKEWSTFDQVAIGDSAPKGQGSFGFNMRYKRISLYTSFLYEYGGSQYNHTLVSNVENVNLLYKNADRRVLTDRWIEVGDEAPLKAVQDRLHVTRPTSRFIQTNNQLIFNSASLSYDFGDTFLSQLKLRRLKLTLSMKDIARITSVKQEMGLTYPFARTVNLGVNVNF